jgi:hypothetical protein
LSDNKEDHNSKEDYNVIKYLSDSKEDYNVIKHLSDSKGDHNVIKHLSDSKGDHNVINTLWLFLLFYIYFITLWNTQR